jgi:hypothetical protein
MALYKGESSIDFLFKKNAPEQRNNVGMIAIFKKSSAVAI